VLKGWCIVNHVCQEITDYVRACEHLLCKEGALTEDERGLLEYYVKELSREFLGGRRLYDTLKAGRHPETAREDLQPSSSVNRLS